MQTLVVKLYSVEKGELPDTHGARVIGFWKAEDGTRRMFTVQMFHWNKKTNKFYWHNTIAHHIAFWCYESDLTEGPDEGNGPKNPINPK